MKKNTSVTTTAIAAFVAPCIPFRELLYQVTTPLNTATIAADVSSVPETGCSDMRVTTSSRSR